MRGLVIDGARHRSRCIVVLLSLAAAAGLPALAARDAGAFTLKLAFPNGQPMTYGSACAGSGCLEHGVGLSGTDDAGEVDLPGQPKDVEYRRDGIDLSQAPPGTASGGMPVVADSATVTMAHLLLPGAPEVDAVESDLVARINEARVAEGLTPAQINHRLAASADLQAAWLARSAMPFDRLDLLHVGQYDTTLGFRRAEVSFPGPTQDGEVAATGASNAEAVGDWLASPLHRATLLAPGAALIGAARAGGFLVVQTHPPCANCEQAGTGVRSDDVSPPPPLSPLSPATAAGASGTTSGSGASGGAGDAGSAPPCARELLAVRRLADRRQRVRVRVDTECLRPGARYSLLVRQNATGKMLVTRRITHAGRVTLRLRPSRRARSLRVKLKRDGRAVGARTLSLRRR
ncbi:MAG: hypothetical protein QOJ89_1795 [bacterium]